MRGRTLEYTMLLLSAVILIIFSGCTGVKPFYAAGNSGNFVSEYSAMVRGKKINRSTLYSFVPTSRGYNEEGSGDINFKNSSWKFSVSYPASVKFEY